MEDFAPYDPTHLFWDQIKQMGFALRDIRREDVSDEDIDTLIASCRSCGSRLRMMVTKPITRNGDPHERPLDYNELRHH